MERSTAIKDSRTLPQHLKMEITSIFLLKHYICSCLIIILQLLHDHVVALFSQIMDENDLPTSYHNVVSDKRAGDEEQHLNSVHMALAKVCLSQVQRKKLQGVSK